MKKAVSYRPQLDEYSKLWNSLEIKPETARVAGILSSDMDLTAQKYLTNTWRRNLRDLAPVSRITSAVSSSHAKNAVRIWEAAFAALAQNGRELCVPYQDLKNKLGEIPKSTVAVAIEHILEKGTSNFEFLENIPNYVLQRLVDDNITFWSLAATPSQLGKLLIPLARRGIYPKSIESVQGLKKLNRSQQLEYIQATTEYLTEFQVCSGISSALCRLFIKLGLPSTLLARFLTACKASRQPVVKQHPIGTSVVAALYVHNLKDLVPLIEDQQQPQKFLAPSPPAKSVYQAYHNIVNAPSAPPLAIAQLYSNWLRCCARDTPHDLFRFHDTACEAVTGLEGGLKPGRKRVLLSGIVQGLVDSKNWKLLESFVPQIKHTNTPYLWNAALVATNDWTIAEEMKAKKISINRYAMFGLLRSGELGDLERLLPLVDVLPQGILAAFLQRTVDKNSFNYEGLIQFFRQVFQAVTSDLKKKHVLYPFVDTAAVEAVVLGALRTKPKAPWLITPLLGELVDSKLTQTHIVAEGISRALQAVQQGDSGTTVHIRNHLVVDGSELANRFNSEWNASGG